MKCPAESVGKVRQEASECAGCVALLLVNGVPERFEARWEGKAGKEKTGPFRTAFPVPDGAFPFGVPAKGVFCAVFQAVQRMRALLCRKPAVRMLRTASSFCARGRRHCTAGADARFFPLSGLAQSRRTGGRFGFRGIGQRNGRQQGIPGAAASRSVYPPGDIGATGFIVTENGRMRPVVAAASLRPFFCRLRLPVHIAIDKRMKSLDTR